MEYRAVQDKRIERSCFLRIAPDVLHSIGAVFTADISNKSGVDTIEVPMASKDLGDLDTIYGDKPDRWWKNEEFLTRLRRAEKYELLVPNHIPAQQILNFRDG